MSTSALYVTFNFFINTYEKTQTVSDLGFRINGGGEEIRTLGRVLAVAGFQDRCFRPLSHPSAVSDAYITGFTLSVNNIYKKILNFSNLAITLEFLRLLNKHKNA